MLLLLLMLTCVSSDERDEVFQKVFSATEEGKYEVALQHLNGLVKKNGKDSAAIYHRGRVHFQLGKIKESIADFDQHVKLSPNMASRQWERGISLYYGGKFKTGAEQFELYQSYHDNDVENSTWRFLCVARHQDIKTARKTLLPIRNDRRVPMMEIYQMYQGKMTAEAVLKAVEEQTRSDAEKNRALFYANLYIGLLKEAEGKEKEAIPFIQKAKSHKIDHYMWDVANVHLKVQAAKKKK